MKNRLLFAGIFGVSPVLGCAMRPHTLEDSYRVGLEKSDSLYENRDSEASLREALQVLDSLPAEAALEPEVLARRARLLYTLARSGSDAEPGPEALLEEGRSVAWRCLGSVPTVSAAFQESGQQITASVVNLIPGDHADCAVWFTGCWVRWLEFQDGAVATMDLPHVRPILRRARDIAPSQVAFLWQMEGVAESLPSSPYAPDWQRVEAAFDKAQSLRPDDVGLLADRAIATRRQSPTRSMRELLETMVKLGHGTSGPLTLENQRALAWAEAELAR